MIYQLKEEFGPPDHYIVAHGGKVHLKDGKVVWSTNCVGHLKSTIYKVAI